MLGAKIEVKGLNSAHVANKLLKLFQYAWNHEARIAMRSFDEPRNWKVARGFHSGDSYRRQLREALEAKDRDKAWIAARAILKYQPNDREANNAIAFLSSLKAEKGESNESR